MSRSPNADRISEIWKEMQTFTVPEQMVLALYLAQALDAIAVDRTATRHPGVVDNPVCRFCQCTGEAACPGGCFWVLPDVCSACAIVQLDKAALPSYALSVAAQRLREGVIGLPAFGDPTLLATVPLPALALFLTVADAWGAMVFDQQVAFATDVTGNAQQIAEATALAVEIWDQFAAMGAVINRDEAGRIVTQILRAASEHNASLAIEEPAPPPLWRPGDPVD